MHVRLDWIDLAKYFIHGMAFSLILMVLGFVWFFLVLVLVSIGFLLGFLIGLILLFFLIGGLNSILTNTIWSIPIETGWKSLLSHGILLSVLLIIAHIPIYAIVLGFSSSNTIFVGEIASWGEVLPYLIIFVVVEVFIDGLLAKSVAGWWKKFECIHCGMKLPKYAKECYYCGLVQPSISDKRQEKEHTELPKTCPKCGKEMWLNYKICPQCREALPKWYNHWFKQVMVHTC